MSNWRNTPEQLANQESVTRFKAATDDPDQNAALREDNQTVKDCFQGCYWLLIDCNEMLISHGVDSLNQVITAQLDKINAAIKLL